MISRDRSDNITTRLRWTSDASSDFRSMGLVPIIPSHGRDVIIGLAWINLEFRDLFGRADSCRLPHKAWIERRPAASAPPCWGRFFLERPDARRFPERFTSGPTNRCADRHSPIG